MEKVKKMLKIFNSVVVTNLNNIPLNYQLKASEDECKLLEERFNIFKIKSFIGDISLFRDDFVHVKGKIKVQMLRQSVVSLKNFNDQMEESFDVLYLEPPIPEVEEIVDEIHNGRINLGEVLAEQFGLSLDPFPHAPDEKNGFVYVEKNEKSNNPFKNLSKIMKK